MLCASAFELESDGEDERANEDIYLFNYLQVGFHAVYGPNLRAEAPGLLAAFCLSSSLSVCIFQCVCVCKKTSTGTISSITSS